MNWYSIHNIEELTTPALVVYPDRVRENLRILLTFVPDVNRLRPHVKTNKCAEVCAMMMEAGIYKFKCATIAEAEMLGTLQARDVLLAYQPVGPTVNRLLALIRQFPNTRFSCVLDNAGSATVLAAQAKAAGLTVPVFIDLNVGMNRTGISPDRAYELVGHCVSLQGIEVVGLHAYDGHLRDVDLVIRKSKCDAGFLAVEMLKDQIENQYKSNMVVVAGGTPTFPIHAQRTPVECSPGTFIFWDYGYQQLLPEQPFLFAAVIVTRVISVPAAHLATTDLGHKAIASENPLAQRVHFLNAEGVEAIGHSEEHLVLKTPGTLTVGDVLYGVPHHICPTVALHETLAIVKDHTVVDHWAVVSRKRKITV